MLFHRSIVLVAILLPHSGSSFGQQNIDSPLQFVQRQDVGLELNLRPEQREMAQRLQPTCDTQCQARIMEMFTDAGTDLQSMFLALEPDQQQTAITSLATGIREQIESEALADNVLSESQAIRFQQLRTQFRGLGSLLDDRVRTLMGINDDQVNQINQIQDFGNDLINSCQSNPNLTPQQQQAGINAVQNAVIDQSINILNGAQIDIFIGLCGERCNFDDISPEGSPTDPNGDPSPDSATPQVADADANTVIPQGTTNPNSANANQPQAEQSDSFPTASNGSGTRNGSTTRNAAQDSRRNSTNAIRSNSRFGSSRSNLNGFRSNARPSSRGRQNTGSRNSGRSSNQGSQSR